MMPGAPSFGAQDATDVWKSLIGIIPDSLSAASHGSCELMSMERERESSTNATCSTDVHGDVELPEGI